MQRILIAAVITKYHILLNHMCKRCKAHSWTGKVL